jgi:LuxR family transcriptional regulator, maltose regulon positive regulatory protein
VSAAPARQPKRTTTRTLRRPGHVALPFDVVASKLHAPVLRSGTVARTGLVNRLRASHAPVMTVTAPAGYGKTTLVAQWTARHPDRFAWISVDERDDDAVVLLRELAAAVHALAPLERSVLEALAAPSPSMWASALPRLGAALSEFEGGLVVVLDDAHRLRSRESLQAVMTLTDHLSPGSVLVLAGRATPDLPIAELRAAGRLFEVGAEDLALTPREAKLLLGGAGANLTLAETTELVSQCEGWPAALYLAALAAREDEQRPPRKRARRHRYAADYLRKEYLSRLQPEALRFLRRTSVLDVMCDALCSAVLQDGSGTELATIERSNLFLIPLDRERVWYRYHHLFRDLLRRELADKEPELMTPLHRRAAVWYERNGDLESALGHARAANDLDHAARIVTTIALPVYYSGRVGTVERWIADFDEPELLARYPDVAVHGSLIHALRGRPDEAERLLESAEAAPDRRVAAALQPWIATVRATMGTRGVYQMIADAERALAGLPRESQFRPSALLALGMGYVLLGQNERADAIFASAASEGGRLGATATQIVAISERSLLASAREDHSAAGTLAVEARELAEESHLDRYTTSSLAIAASGRESLRHGRWEEARVHLAKARRLWPARAHSLPWLTLQTLIEETRGYLALRDTEKATSLLNEIRALLRERPYVGVLADEARCLEREVENMPHRGDAADAGLTAAELRLLPYLATHLSFREIGDELFVSRNTVKTQAISIYRKFGVSSRSEAIERGVALGLAMSGSDAFIHAG